MMNLELVEECLTAERLKQLKDFARNARWILCVDDKGRTYTIDLKKEKI